MSKEKQEIFLEDVDLKAKHCAKFAHSALKLRLGLIRYV